VSSPDGVLCAGSCDLADEAAELDEELGIRIAEVVVGVASDSFELRWQRADRRRS